MDETRKDGTATLAEQLEHFEATGQLLPGGHLIEGMARVDRYLQAIALAHRARSGGEACKR